MDTLALRRGVKVRAFGIVLGQHRRRRQLRFARGLSCTMPRFCRVAAPERHSSSLAGRKTSSGMLGMLTLSNQGFR